MKKKVAALLATLMVGAAAGSACLASDIIINGTFDARYSNANDRGMYNFSPDLTKKSGFYHRADINLIAPVSKDVSFIGALFAGSRSSSSIADRLDSPSVKLAMIVAKKGNAEYHVGRLAFQQGLGLTGTTPYFDGASVELKTDKLTTILVGGNTFITTYDPDLANPISSGNHNFYGVDAAYDIDKDKKIIATLWQNGDKDVYKTATMGYKQNINEDWVVSGEYGRNDSTLAKDNNGGSAAKAYFARVKYQGADPAKLGSSGVSLTYIKADPYFDPCSDTLLETTPNGWNYPTNGSNIDNTKGLVFSYEQTVFDKTVFKVNYAPVKRVKDMNGVPDDRSYVTADLIIHF
ncbi:hypothetical protein [Sporomusa malonica]|uniref:Beta-barrel porin-2, OmpL-like. bbp2 n=1 Tax=Sporomusa malonica TaxID=112901 RepID=A0A1W1ZF06_9FIRM|nr:hypothetical protein [Sporomusa malonica]SMC46926.1 hypothetical protein SAMN04488500_103253 [Sporomusa malonica]